LRTFNIGDRTGQQLKTVDGATDDPNPTQPRHSHSQGEYRADAGDQTASCLLADGEEPKPKKVSVMKAAKEFPAKEITIKSNSPNSNPKWSRASWRMDHRSYPKDTSHPVEPALQIQTDYPKEAPSRSTLMSW